MVLFSHAWARAIYVFGFVWGMTARIAAEATGL